MIDFLCGTIVARHPTEVIVQVGGIGFQVQVPLSTYEQLPESGEARLLTYLHVREDSWKLFGFASEAERAMFKLLLSVSGIGPSIALTALSGSSVGQLQEVILAEDASALSKIKGIGKKTSQRIVVELKDSVQRIPGGAEVPAPVSHHHLEDAILGLLSLGYTRSSSQRAVSRAVQELGPQAKTEDIVRQALQYV